MKILIVEDDPQVTHIAGILAGAGYRGLSGVVDRVEKADDANRIIKWALESRRDEKNFMLRQDKASADNVNKNISVIINLAKDMKSRFKQEKNKAQADSRCSQCRRISLCL